MFITLYIFRFYSYIIYFLDFDSQDLGGSSVLDSDYLTMLGSSDKLMSGEFEALERLQAELDLFDDPNRPEEIVEQMAVENHLDLIEEVCSDTGDNLISEETVNVKEEVESEGEQSELDTSVQPQVSEPLIQQIKIEPSDDEQENVVTLKQSQSQSEIISAGNSGTSKRSAPPSVQENQQSKKSVR